MKTIKVNVTANDIAKGQRLDGRKCPVARAILRHRVMRSREYALVYSTYLNYSDDHGGTQIAGFPRAVHEWITQYDITRPGNRDRIKPISFDLELPGVEA